MALRRAPVSGLYPLSSLSYVVVAVGGAWLLGEHVTLSRAVGIAVILLGVLVVARS